MYSLPGNVYTLAILLFFQGFLVLLIIFLFMDKFFSNRKHRLESAVIKQEAYEQAVKELELAKIKAQQIIKDAQASAANIISKSQYISTDTQKGLSEDIKGLVTRQEQEVTKVIENFSKELKSEFDREKVTTLAGLDAVFQELKNESVKQVSSYNDILTKNSLDTENTLKTQTDRLLEETRQRLKTYEDVHMKKIQDHIFGTLLSVSKSFFGQTMTINDHEELVIKLLEEAKLKESLGL